MTAAHEASGRVDAWWALMATRCAGDPASRCRWPGGRCVRGTSRRPGSGRQARRAACVRSRWPWMTSNSPRRARSIAIVGRRDLPGLAVAEAGGPERRGNRDNPLSGHGGVAGAEGGHRVPACDEPLRQCGDDPLRAAVSRGRDRLGGRRQQGDAQGGAGHRQIVFTDHVFTSRGLRAVVATSRVPRRFPCVAKHRARPIAWVCARDRDRLQRRVRTDPRRPPAGRCRPPCRAGR